MKWSSEISIFTVNNISISINTENPMVDGVIIPEKSDYLPKWEIKLPNSVPTFEENILLSGSRNKVFTWLTQKLWSRKS